MSNVQVVDTSVLLSAGKAGLFAFPGDEIVLPLVVVKELESKRNDPNLGIYAREVLREIESIRQTVGGSLATGKKLSNGSLLRVEVNHVSPGENLPDSIKSDMSNDTRILIVAHSLREEGRDVTVVSKDLPMRILADSIFNLKAEDFTQEIGPVEDIDSIKTIKMSTESIDEFYGNGFIHIPDELPMNSPLILKGEDKSASALAIARPGYKAERIHPDRFSKYISPKSTEQSFALGLLANDDVKIVSLGGRAGTGKTLLAIAAGLVMAEQQGSGIQKVTVFRPVSAVGSEQIGFLPGSEAEKMEPVAEAVYDALRAIMPSDKIKSIKSKELLEVRPLTHIRGRTLPSTWVIIDEAQNLEKNVLMTALSRLGNNSKAVLCFDLEQRDNLRVGKHDGVYSVVQALYGDRLFGHVTFKKTERSDVAELINRKIIT